MELIRVRPASLIKSVKPIVMCGRMGDEREDEVVRYVMIWLRCVWKHEKSKSAPVKLR